MSKTILMNRNDLQNFQGWQHGARGLHLPRCAGAQVAEPTFTYPKLGGVMRLKHKSFRYPEYGTWLSWYPIQDPEDLTLWWPGKKQTAGLELQVYSWVDLKPVCVNGTREHILATTESYCSISIILFSNNRSAAGDKTHTDRCRPPGRWQVRHTCELRATNTYPLGRHEYSFSYNRCSC